MFSRGLFFLALPFSLLLLFSSLSVAHAEDAVWSYVIPATLYSQHVPPWNDVPNYFSLSNINVQVSYHANATNLATGASICSGTVTVGDRVRFAPQPYAYTDIYWFGSGGANDSPYGDWIESAAQPADAAMCLDKNLVYIQPIWRAGYGPRNHYVDLSVNPPDARTVTVPQNLFSCGSPASDGSVTCTATTAGSGAATFNFASTYGILYKAYQDPYYAPAHPYTEQCTWDDPLYTLPDANTYALSVPSQTISCPITVIDATGNPPATPTLTSAGQCVVGTPHTLSMVSSDPDGDNLKYGIDWDADGSVNEWVPPSGYVASGSTQTATRTYSIAGSKTVKVKAIDANGLTSSWASISFNCADSTTAALNEGSDISGDDTGGDDTQLLLLPDLDLRVIPSLVRSGNTTKVNWSTVNVKSCTMSGENGDSWTGLQSTLGGNISKPIIGETTYILSCIDLNGTTLTKQATVRIIPTFQEK